MDCRPVYGLAGRRLLGRLRYPDCAARRQSIVRLRRRKAHLWSGSYLAHRYLWSNLEAAVAQAKGELPADSKVVLDVGCGNRPYADLFADCQYVGLNYSAQDACPDVIADA